MKKIYIIFSILFITSISAQIEYKIKNVKVNGISIPDNSPIEFNGQPSVVVNFKVEFTKPADLYIGGVSHVIGTYNSLGQFLQLISPEQFSLPSVTNTGFSGTWEKTLYASDYTYDGGNYLVSILQQTDAMQNGRWESNRVYINRGPNFQLNYSTLSIPCGNIGSRTFTISNLSNSTGVISYNWNIGSGWSGLVNSNMSSITLTPLNGNVLPSNVSVTPIYNGVTQATKTCVVSRAPFNTSTLSITGNSYVCDTGIYSINNLPNSIVIQSVTSSNNNIATVSLTGTNEILVTKVSDGVVSITASIQNTCNQTATISKENIQIGIPSNVNDAVISGSSSVCSNQYYTYTITEASHPCITTSDWDVSPNLQIISQNSNSITVVKNPFENQNSGYISYSIPNTNVEIRKGVWVGLPENLGLNIQKIGSYDFYAGSWTTLKATYSALIYPESGNYNLTYEWIIPNSYVRNYTDTAYKDVNPRSSDQLNIGIRAWNECGCTDWFYKLFDVISAGTSGGNGGGNVLTPAD